MRNFPHCDATKASGPCVLCFSSKYWQRIEAVADGQHSWVIHFGRWIINFRISTFCQTAATLPQRKRRRAGWAAHAAKLLHPSGDGHGPGDGPGSAHGCNLLLLAGRSAKHSVSSQVKDVTACQAAPGQSAAAACHEQVSRPGRTSVQLCLCCRERKSCAIFLFFFI